jgi:hypothetical protein
MSSLNAAMALTALANVDVKLVVNGLRGISTWNC